MLNVKIAFDKDLMKLKGNMQTELHAKVIECICMK